MKNLKLLLLPVATLMLSSVTLAGDEGFTADQAFMAMLTLEGTWTGDAVVVQWGKQERTAPQPAPR